MTEQVADPQTDMEIALCRALAYYVAKHGKLHGSQWRSADVPIDPKMQYLIILKSDVLACSVLVEKEQ